ncbi:MAG: EpsG family protein [Bacteroidota bacterium]
MYLFTFSLLGLFAIDDIFLKRKKYHLAFMLIAVLWIIFHDGFRWGVATDWKNYHDFFLICLDGDTSEFEIGYVLFSQAVRSVTDNYSVFLVIHAIIVYSLISRSILKYAVNPLFSFFFFYCLMLTYLGMNRQYISFAICIYAYRYIFDRRLYPFLFCIFIAFLFHKSSIMFVLAYFLNREFKTKILIYLLTTFALISLSGVMNKLPLSLFFLFGDNAGDRLSFYSETAQSGTNAILSLLALVKRSIWIILALIYKDHIKNKDEHYNFFFNLYFAGALMYMLFNNTMLHIIVARGILYFNIAEIFLIPYLLSVFKEGISKAVMFILVLIYGFLMVQKGMNFYKENLGIDIYRPYNSVLMDNTYDAMEQ